MAEIAKIDKPSNVDLHAAAVEDYKYALEDLHILMTNGAQECTAFREGVRDLFHSIVIHPTEPEAPMRVDLNGKLFGMAGEPVAELVVAGAGFEPAAFRL